ncbi:MAG: tetratricopeptide repeat protein [Alphaproteobacteria bacterium]|nr:tetratricopeptide repeat protein [Alphaproteobacteria bacterium]
MKKKLQNQINEDALLREVVEDVKNEELQQLWNKYGLFIIVGVALVLTVAISFESIRNWRDKKNQELSNAYSVAMSLQNQGRIDESLEIYTTLAEKASGIYDDLAKMQIANIYLEQGKKEDALAVLKALIESKNTIPQMRDVASLKLVSYKLDTDASKDEIMVLLQPMLEKEKGFEIAHELMAMLYIRENDIESAKAQYQKIATSADVSETIKSRALDMVNLLNEQ